MDQLDRIFKTLGLERPGAATLIACLYSGASKPRASVPMPRDPVPGSGARIDQLGQALDQALAINQAIHDGAIMVGRLDAASPFKITGWSYRLFPSGRAEARAVNRGSAFHSCLAMSHEPDVEVMYLVSAGRAYRFWRGEIVGL